jgi:AraC-like DNA-binding protein
LDWHERKTAHTLIQNEMEFSVNTATLAGAFLAAVMAAGYAVRPWNQRNLLLAAFLLLLGFLQLLSALYHSPRAESHAFSLALLPPAILLAGPLLYLVYCSLYGDIRLSRKAALHIAPAVFLSLALPFLQAGGLQDLISDHFQRRELDRFKILILVGIGSVLFYITYIFLHVRRFYLKSGIRGRSLAGAISAVVYFLLASAALVGLLVDASALTRSANAGATVLIVCLYLAQARYPEFLGELAAEVRRRRGESHLVRLDLEALRSRLLHLMETEKAYCDEDLTLPALAELAGVSTHQLSEYINNHMHKNFNRFINEFRIREARTLLVEQPDRTILSVGLAVGFNSNSAFHQSFREFTGITPARFRRQRSSSAETSDL